MSVRFGSFASGGSAAGAKGGGGSSSVVGSTGGSGCKFCEVFVCLKARLNSDRNHNEL